MVSAFRSLWRRRGPGRTPRKTRDLGRKPGAAGASPAADLGERSGEVGAPAQALRALPRAAPFDRAIYLYSSEQTTRAKQRELERGARGGAGAWKGWGPLFCGRDLLVGAGKGKSLPTEVWGPRSVGPSDCQ